jgi:3-hydroxyacyl-CoA dehydrogenase
VRIETIAVIGAGEFGREIARFALHGGYRIILEDVSDSILEKAVAAIRENLAADASAARLDAASCDQALLRLSTAHCVEDAAREADCIIETVADEPEMKLELFTIFDKFARPGAIFASTTQLLAIDDLADMTFCAERCVGMQFARGAGNKRRLQLVRGRGTSGETIEACHEMARRMDLQVVELRNEHALPGAGD